MSRSGAKVVELHPRPRGRPLGASAIDPQEWRAEFRGALVLFNGDEGRMSQLAKQLQRGITARAWTQFADARGKRFTEFNDFCRHPEPEGLGAEPEDIRHLLEKLFGKRRAKFLTVPLSRQGQTSTPGAEKSRNDERLRAILRAPEVVQDLVVAELLSEKEGQKFGRVAPPPEIRKKIRAFCKRAPRWLSQLESDASQKKTLRKHIREAMGETFSGEQPKETIYTAHVGSNADLFPSVLAVHVPLGARVIDVTYGKGNFWKNVPRGAYKLTRCDIQSGTDLRDLPLREDSFDALILDPPYISKSDSPSALSQDHEERYQNLARRSKGHQAILDLYVAGAKEARRVLTERGALIVKTQGEVTNGKQYLTHYEIYEAYKRLGWHLDDEFVLVQDGKLPNSSTVQRQYHARKNHSLFLVFRMSNKRRRSRNS